MEKQNKLEQLGRTVASHLSRAGKGLSKRIKKLILLAVVVCIGTYCMVLVTGNSRTMLRPSSISFVKLPEKKALELRVNGLSAYLDSLQQTASGRHAYDSLLKVHPHLQDSIQDWKAKLSQMP